MQPSPVATSVAYQGDGDGSPASIEGRELKIALTKKA